MKRGSMKKWAAVCLAGITILVLTACGGEETGSRNLLNNEEDNEKTVNLFVAYGENKSGRCECGEKRL